MRQFLLIVCVSMIMSSCRKESSDTPSLPLVRSNISYGTDPLQTFDLYLPSNHGDSTVLAVMIHGGSWASGDKSELNGYIPELQKRLPGMAFANVNYRLVNGTRNRFPTQEEDVQAVIEYLQEKAGEYEISRKIVLMGVSAGGHLALLQGYKHKGQVQPRAIVSLFGPTDLADLYTNPVNPLTPIGLIGITGYSLDQNPAVYADASPVNFVTPDVAPTLLLQGAQDSLVSVSQQLMLKSRLEEKQVPVQLVIYPNAGHGFYGTNLTDALDRIRDFLVVYGR